MATSECWFDLDGVVRTLSFNLKEIELNRKNEKLFWHLQRFWLLRRTYNFLIRKPNPEIIAFMEELNERRIGMSLVSAAQEHHREELMIWFREMKIHYFKTIILKELFEENWQDYKVRIVSNSCDYYLDDMEKIVQRINNSNGRCRAIHYHGQTKKELLKELFPVFV